MTEDLDDELSSSIKAHAVHHTAPMSLRNQIVDAIRENEPVRSSTETDKPRHPWLKPWWPTSGWGQWISLGATFASGVFVAWIVTTLMQAQGATNRLENELVSDHVRSLMVDHVADVISTDRHTVKPWFNGKLDFSPPVHDLTSDGFPLTGGRLDYIAGRDVAALVFKRRLHTINLYIWPSAKSGITDFSVAARQGFNMVSWSSGGMQYWAVSDLNKRELGDFTRLYKAKVLVEE